MVFDQINLNTNTTNRIKYKDGFLGVKNNILSSAVVSPYFAKNIPGATEKGYQPDQTIYALRDPQELEKSIRTFDGLPLLLLHKETNSKNIKDAPRVGSVGNDIAFNKPDMVGSLYVHDQDAIDLIEHPKEEDRISSISCGYSFTPIFEKGIYEGKAYDVRMTEIVGNHIALVKKGRVETAKVADENIIKGNKMSLGSFWKLLPKKQITNDEDMKFDHMDLRSIMRDIEASDMTDDEKNNKIKDLMERMSSSSVDKNLSGDNDTSKVKDEDDTKENDKDSEKDDKSEKIVDNKMLRSLIEEIVENHLAKLHKAADREDKENDKAMDEALNTYRKLHGEPNINSFDRKPENVYKSILKNKNIACDEMDIKELKAAINILEQINIKPSYVSDSAINKKSSSIFDNDLVKSRKVK